MGELELIEGDTANNRVESVTFSLQNEQILGYVTVNQAYQDYLASTSVHAPMMFSVSPMAADTDWRSGSILDGDFDAEIEALDAIDEELNQRSWDRYNSQDHSNESYGVHREHGWYLPNDD